VLPFQDVAYVILDCWKASFSEDFFAGCGSCDLAAEDSAVFEKQKRLSLQQAVVVWAYEVER
jgi:hypothetical protein